VNGSSRLGGVSGFLEGLHQPDKRFVGFTRQVLRAESIRQPHAPFRGEFERFLPSGEVYLSPGGSALKHLNVQNLIQIYNPTSKNGEVHGPDLTPYLTGSRVTVLPLIHPRLEADGMAR
jgi:hypothetical protein